MFLLIIYMVHWLSVRYLICLNQPCFNLRDIHQKACGLFFSVIMVLFSSPSKNTYEAHDEFDDSELIFTRSNVLKRGQVRKKKKLTMWALA